MKPLEQRIMKLITAGRSTLSDLHRAVRAYSPGTVNSAVSRLIENRHAMIVYGRIKPTSSGIKALKNAQRRTVGEQRQV